METKGPGLKRDTQYQVMAGGEREACIKMKGTSVTDLIVTFTLVVRATEASHARGRVGKGGVV